MPMARIALMATCLEMITALATDTKFGANIAKKIVTAIRAMKVRSFSASSSAAFAPERAGWAVAMLDMAHPGGLSGRLLFLCRGADDELVVGLVGAKIGGDPAVSHHQDAVGHGVGLLEIGGCVDNRQAV